jgi:hypothetical protein
VDVCEGDDEVLQIQAAESARQHDSTTARGHCTGPWCFRELGCGERWTRHAQPSPRGGVEGQNEAGNEYCVDISDTVRTQHRPRGRTGALIVQVQSNAKPRTAPMTSPCAGSLLRRG